MSKIEQIRSEMVAAMKAKDKERKDALHASRFLEKQSHRQAQRPDRSRRK